MGRALGGEHRDGRLPVASVDRLEQVGRLGLGGQPRRGTAALDVDEDERELEADGEAERLRLERETGTARRRETEVSPEGGPDGSPDAGDLVLGLERAHAEPLVLRQLVEDVRGWGDRVRAQEDREAGLLARGDEAPREGGVAGDVGVRAARERGRLHLVGVVEQLGGLTEGVACLERRQVGSGHEWP